MTEYAEPLLVSTGGGVLPGYTAPKSTWECRPGYVLVGLTILAVVGLVFYILVTVF